MRSPSFVRNLASVPLKSSCKTSGCDSPSWLPRCCWALSPLTFIPPTNLTVWLWFGYFLFLQLDSKSLEDRGKGTPRHLPEASLVGICVWGKEMAVCSVTPMPLYLGDEEVGCQLNCPYRQPPTEIGVLQATEDPTFSF